MKQIEVNGHSYQVFGQWEKLNQPLPHVVDAETGEAVGDRQQELLQQYLNEQGEWYPPDASVNRLIQSVLKQEAAPVFWTAPEPPAPYPQTPSYPQNEPFPQTPAEPYPQTPVETFPQAPAAPVRIPTLDKIYHAAYVLREVARKTDLIHAVRLSETCDCAVYLKTENLQVTGSFKVRGAYYKISQLTREQKAAGIIACSAGNHAQGVALAATRMGAKSTVCMPDGAPISKVEATKRLGADVCLVPGAYDDAYAYALKLRDETGATFIHPFDDEQVIAGQGTIGLEILDQLPDVDAVVVPVGGGGLIAGVATAIKSLNPRVKVYGVQAERAASMLESRRAGRQITLDRVDTFADGIAVKHPGDLTWSICGQYVDEIVTVSEDEIATAVLALIENQKLIAEGAGAVSVAAVLFNKLPVAGKKVVCLVSGGNIDVNILSRVITRGLVTSGRSSRMQIALEDKPGQLTRVSTIISEHGGNVISVQYERSDANMAISSCFLTIGLETRDFEQIESIRKALTDEGFHIVN